MSISHKKINEMIKTAVSDLNAFGREQQAFNSLCEKIYLIESSLNESTSATKIISEMREEIMSRAIDFKEESK